MDGKKGRRGEGGSGVMSVINLQQSKSELVSELTDK